MNTITAAIAAGAAALAVIAAPVAHADPNDPCEQYSHSPDGYTADLHRCGFSSLKSDDWMMTSGQRLCGEMRSLKAKGQDPSKVRRAVADTTGWGYDTAVDFVAITIADLCPELAANR